MTQWKSIFKMFLLMIYVPLKELVLLFFPRSMRYKEIKGEIALITGAGSGIGRELAIRFSQKGCKVVLWDINAAGLEQSKEMITGNGGQCHTYVCDVSQRKVVYEVAEKVKREVGSVSILVNNAGIVNGKLFKDLKDEQMVKVMEVNAMALFWTHRAFLPDMMEKNHGHVVNVSSVSGMCGFAHLTDYAASKHAAVGFNEAISNELLFGGHTGVKTTMVCPYYINTGLFNGAKEGAMKHLDPNYVADAILESVLMEKEFVYLPEWLKYPMMLKAVLPSVVNYELGNIFEGNTSMVSFTGRNVIDSNSNTRE